MDSLLCVAQSHVDEGSPSLSKEEVAPEAGLKPQAVYRNLSPAELYEQVSLAAVLMLTCEGRSLRYFCSGRGNDGDLGWQMEKIICMFWNSLQE